MTNSTTSNGTISGTITTGTVLGPVSSATIITGHPYWSTPNSIHIGNGYLEETNGELWWNRPDGSRFCLTGKSAGFKNLYDKLNEDMDGDNTK